MDDSPYTRKNPLFIQPANALPGSAAGNPQYIRFANVPGIDINRVFNPIPVAVQRALPVLDAKKFQVQDLSKYLMQPSRLYDIQDWGAGGVGQTAYTFFSRSIGQTGVTVEQTNMSQANNIGQNNAFVVTRIGVAFISGIRPIITNATDATVVNANGVNDAYNVLTRGAFQLNINGVGQFFGQGIAPLMALPAPQQFEVNGGIATGNAVADIAAGYDISGDVFDFAETPITLVGGASFNAQVLFSSGALTLQSSNAASKLAVYLDGYALRPAG